MTLHIYNNIEQGTEEWFAVRRGIVTASVVGQLITAKTLKVAANDTSRGLTAMLVAERITGYTEPSYQSDDMLRGTLSEPYARELYGEHHAAVREVGFMVREESGWKLGYSPDGLVGDDGLIEIKAPRQKTHLATILADRVPDMYMAQCQTGLFVSGRKWLDFISYSGGMPFYVKRVLPDEKWQKAIVEAVTEFEKNAAVMMADYLAAVEGLPVAEHVEFFAELEL